VMITFTANTSAIQPTAAAEIFAGQQRFHASVRQYQAMADGWFASERERSQVLLHKALAL